MCRTSSGKVLALTSVEHLDKISLFYPWKLIKQGLEIFSRRNNVTAPWIKLGSFYGEFEAFQRSGP